MKKSWLLTLECLPHSLRTVSMLMARCRENAETGCWEWVQGSTRGYGIVATRERKPVLARRAAFLICTGRDVRPSFRLFARCQNASCVRIDPKHVTERRAKVAAIAAAKMRDAELHRWRCIDARKSARLLTSEEVVALRDLFYLRRNTVEELAASVGMSKNSCWSMLVGKTYADVPRAFVRPP
jgi:hypothetical protein